MTGLAISFRAASAPARSKATSTSADAAEYVLDNAVRAGTLRDARRLALVRRRAARRTYADACTGESAGAHEQSGEASPPRPFRRR